MKAALSTILDDDEIANYQRLGINPDTDCLQRVTNVGKDAVASRLSEITEKFALLPVENQETLLASTHAAVDAAIAELPPE